MRYRQLRASPLSRLGGPAPSFCAFCSAPREFGCARSAGASAGGCLPVPEWHRLCPPCWVSGAQASAPHCKILLYLSVRFVGTLSVHPDLTAHQLAHLRHFALLDMQPRLAANPISHSEKHCTTMHIHAWPDLVAVSPAICPLPTWYKDAILQKYWAPFHWVLPCMQPEPHSGYCCPRLIRGPPNTLK